MAFIQRTASGEMKDDHDFRLPHHDSLGEAEKEKDDQQETHGIGDVCVQTAMVHARQQSRDPSDSISHRVKEQPVHKVRLVPAPENSCPEMNGNRVSRVLDNVGPKYRLENDPHGV